MQWGWQPILAIALRPYWAGYEPYIYMNLFLLENVMIAQHFCIPILFVTNISLICFCGAPAREVDQSLWTFPSLVSWVYRIPVEQLLSFQEQVFPGSVIFADMLTQGLRHLCAVSLDAIGLLPTSPCQLWCSGKCSGLSVGLQTRWVKKPWILVAVQGLML